MMFALSDSISPAPSFPAPWPSSIRLLFARAARALRMVAVAGGAIAAAGVSEPEAATFDLILNSSGVPLTQGTFEVPDALLGPANANGFIRFSQFIKFDITINESRFDLPGDIIYDPGDGLLLNASGQPLAFRNINFFSAYLIDDDRTAPLGGQNYLHFIVDSYPRWFMRDYWTGQSWGGDAYQIVSSCVVRATFRAAAACPPPFSLPTYNDKRYCKSGNQVVVSSLLFKRSGGGAITSRFPQVAQLAAMILLVPDKAAQDKLYKAAIIALSKKDPTDQLEIAFKSIYYDARWATALRGAVYDIQANVLSALLHTTVKKLLPSKNKPSALLQKYTRWYIEEIISNYISTPSIKAVIDRPCNLSAEDIARAVTKYVHGKHPD